MNRSGPLPKHRRATGSVWLKATAAAAVLLMGLGLSHQTRTSANPQISEFFTPTTSAEPQQIVAGPDGNMWFTEEDAFGGPGGIGRSTLQGVITEFPAASGGALNPHGITVGPDGALWFTYDSGPVAFPPSPTSRIGRITTAGVVTSFSLSPTIGNGTPSGCIVTGPDGNLWFTIVDDSGAGVDDAIGRLTPAGVFTRFLTPTVNSEPQCITRGPDGALWFTEGNPAGAGAIGRITTAGVITNEFTGAAINEPHGITTGPDGALWFTNQGNNSIGRITVGGVSTSFPNGSPNGEPVYIVTGPDGALWYGEGGTGPDTNLVGRMTTTGAVTHFATPTANSEPEGVAVGPDGNIWFTESGADFAGPADAIGRIAIAGAGVPTFSAIGCVNSNDQTLIQFPTQPGLLGGAVVSTSNQNNTVNGAGVAVTPASLSVIAPTNAGNGFGAFFSAVTCGAVFQDNDADPNLIAGGTITFNLPNPLGFAQGGLGQILESNGNSFTVSCGAAVALLETCQGANTVISGSQTSCPPPQGPTCVAEPTASNTVHVGLRPNVSFSLIGGFAPVITISATYNRFLSYGPAFSLTTNSFVIGLTAPVYNLSLTPTPNTIPAALGSTTGSVITASLSRVVVAACAPLAAFGAFTICPVPGAVLALGLAVQTLTPGAEPGVVTFQTTSGVFGNPATVNAGSQQVASVHCGAAAGTAPVILTPQVGQLFQFSLTSCTSVSVTLFGGGAAGTAVVTATYVADYTGSTATAATTVTLSATAPTVTLTRGCNEVITGPTVAAAATSAIILALVSPSSAVVSIWQFNNSLHAFQAFYFSTAGAPLDINSVGPNQSLFICVSGTATFTTS